MVGEVALVGTVALLPPAMAFLRRRGAHDGPNARSLHQNPVLRGGGVALLGATVITLAVNSSWSTGLGGDSGRLHLWCYRFDR